MSTSQKLVLITGANKSIGFEIGRQLGTQLLGQFHILVGSRDAARGAAAVEKLKLEGVSAEALTIDVENDASISAAAATIEAKYGRLDVLINNAGIALDSYTSQPTPDRAMYERTFQTNVFGAAITTESFIPLLRNSPAPRIVFVSSDLGSLTRRADPNDSYKDVDFICYRSSKAAMNMLALGYVHRFKAEGLKWKVNVHNPGYTATDFNHNTGPGTVEDAAKNAVRLATLGEDGETGTFSEKEGRLPW